MSKKQIKSIILISLTVLLVTTITSCSGIKKPENNDGDCTHTFGAWQIDKAPSCELDGAEYTECSECGYRDQRAIKALGHSFTNYSFDNNATCTDDGTETSVCDRVGCNREHTRTAADTKTGHTEALCYTVNTADSNKHDAFYPCCDTVVKTADHEWDAGTVTEAPTETAPGKKLLTCTDCGHTRITDIPPVSHVHSAVKFDAKAATCTEAGNVEYWECTGCNKYFSDEACTEELFAESVMIPATHTGGVANCKNSATCTVCGQKYGEPDSNKHISDEFVYHLNSNDKTKHDRAYSCCGKVVETVTHSYPDYTSDNNATCVSNATESAICVCGDRLEREIPNSKLNAHSLVFDYSTPASCTVAATIGYKCKYCDHTECTFTAPATGHSLSSYEVSSIQRIENSACEYTVIYVGKCGNCMSEEAEVSKIETRHTFSSTISSPATCVTAGKKTYKCIHGCDASYDESYTDDLAHSWSVNGDAVNGVQSYTCTNTGCCATKNVIAVNGSEHTVDKSSLSGNEILLSDISILMDNDAINALGEGSVSVSAAELSDAERLDTVATLSKEQLLALGNGKIYSFTVEQNGTSVSDFGEGSVKVTVPYQLGDEDPDCIVVWFIDDGGDVTSLPAEYSNGSVTFTTDHFSSYAPVSLSGGDACIVNGHNLVAGECVEPSCASIGYTVMNCTRCEHTELGDIEYELGHAFTSAPEIIAATCTSNGAYVYVCQNDECGFEQRIPIVAEHSWEQREWHASSCSTEGYIIYECSVCSATKTDMLPISEYGHNIVMEYKLADGAQYCTDGLEVYERCINPGCTHNLLNTTYYDHIPIEKYDGDGGQLNYTTIKLSDYFPDLYKYYPDQEAYISVSMNNCYCGKICSNVSVTDSSVFSMWFSTSYHDIPSETTSEIYRSMQMMYNDPVYLIKIVRRVEKIDCKLWYYVDILIDYNEITDTARETLTYLMNVIESHNTRNEATLATPGTECDDGVYVNHICRDCNKLVSRSWTKPDYGKHYFCFTEHLPYDLSEYSTKGHKSYIRYQVCACGSSNYEYYYTDYYKRCNFTTTTKTLEDGSVLKTHVCDCGIRYAERQKTVVMSQCETYIYETVYYGNYDATTDTYSESIVLSAVTKKQYHVHSTKKVYTPTEYDCYFSYVTEWRCIYCDHLDPSYTYSGYSFVHDTETTFTKNTVGNTVTTVTCKDCDYLKETVSDVAGNTLYTYEERLDVESGGFVRITASYRVINGYSEPVMERREYFSDDSAECIAWENIIYVYTFGTTDGCYTLKYTVDSNGSFEVDRYAACNSAEMIEREPTCSQYGCFGYRCSYCQRESVDLMRPYSHSWVMYDESTYICDRCGTIGCGTYYDTFVILELVEAEGEDYVVGYYNNYFPEAEGLYGTAQLELIVWNAAMEEIKHQLSLTYTDDGSSIITVSKSSIESQLSALDSGYQKYRIVLTVSFDGYEPAAIVLSEVYRQ